MSATLDESIVIQKREAAIASIARINTLHRECCESDGSIAAAILAKINKGRECGRELIDYQSKLKQNPVIDPKGNKIPFTRLFESANGKHVTSYMFPFSYETASIYMRFGRANPEPITVLADGVSCLKDALIASGSLAAPSGHGPQALHSFNFVEHLSKRVFDFRAMWGKQVKEEPIEKWSEDRKEIARDELQWFVDQYKALGGAI